MVAVGTYLEVEVGAEKKFKLPHFFAHLTPHPLILSREQNEIIFFCMQKKKI